MVKKNIEELEKLKHDFVVGVLDEMRQMLRDYGIEQYLIYSPDWPNIGKYISSKQILQSEMNRKAKKSELGKNTEFTNKSVISKVFIEDLLKKKSDLKRICQEKEEKINSELEDLKKLIDPENFKDKLCKFCGEKIVSEEAKFCASCGNNLEKNEPFFAQLKNLPSIKKLMSDKGISGDSLDEDTMIDLVKQLKFGERQEILDRFKGKSLFDDWAKGRDLTWISTPNVVKQFVDHVVQKGIDAYQDGMKEPLKLLKKIDGIGILDDDSLSIIVDRIKKRLDLYTENTDYIVELQSKITDLQMKSDKIREYYRSDIEEFIQGNIAGLIMFDDDDRQNINSFMKRIDEGIGDVFKERMELKKKIKELEKGNGMNNITYTTKHLYKLPIMKEVRAEFGRVCKHLDRAMEDLMKYHRKMIDKAYKKGKKENISEIQSLREQVRRLEINIESLKNMSGKMLTHEYTKPYTYRL